jgi:hypothetical protein
LGFSLTLSIAALKSDSFTNKGKTAGGQEYKVEEGFHEGNIEFSLR